MAGAGGDMRRSTRQRQDRLLGLVRAGTSRVADLAAALRVSPSTVRRDLARLTSDGRVARTYGGAITQDAFTERSVAESQAVARPAKAAIARAAAELVPEGATVFLDAGTTCVALARLVADRRGLTVYTRGLEVAMVLAGSTAVEVVMTGGRVRPLSHGLVGPLAAMALRRIDFDVVFLGADAVHPARGVGEPTLEEIAVKEDAAARSGRTVVLAHAGKLSGSSGGGPPAWSDFPPGWTLVTDESAAPEVLDAYAAGGVEVIVGRTADPGPRPTGEAR
jgi:DeoR/GlpR family transcriptional regulator of sugar metabolism